MKKRIHKYEIYLGDNNLRCNGAPMAVLHAAYQGNRLMVWIEVDEDKQGADILILTLPTGADVPLTATHVSTVLSGAFVWHVYHM